MTFHVYVDNDYHHYAWSKSMNLSMWGYMMGSPTSDNAQCFIASASSTRSLFTPSHPAN